MLTRRIATTLCALCFAAPAAAGASPAQDAPAGGSGPAVHATTKAKGPYGVASATVSARSTVAAHGDDTNDWRTAALSEAALLAAFALGSALLLQTRRSAPRMGT